MRSGGWIPVPRSFFDLPFWAFERFPPAMAILDLRRRAAYRPQQGFTDDRVDIAPGQMFTSMKRLARDWGWTRETVANFLRRLEQRRAMRLQTKRGVAGYSIITLLDCDVFTVRLGADSQQSGITSDSRSAIQADISSDVAPAFESTPNRQVLQ